MTSDKKFGMLRNILRALGLSQGAADEVDFVINNDIKYRIGDDLFEEGD
jgi:hypothetical protein